MHPLKRLLSKKGRDETGLFIVEGEKFVNEIPLSWNVRKYYFSKSYADAREIRGYERRAECEILRDSIFDSVSDTATPQGILAVCEQRTFELNAALRENCFLILGENLSDPGNIGTLIRTAAAAGADGVVLSKNSGEIYNPKTLRAAAGAVLRIPVITGADLRETVERIKAYADKKPDTQNKNAGRFNTRGVSVYATHPRGEIYPYALNLRKGFCFLIGNEARGLTDEAVELADAG